MVAGWLKNCQSCTK